MVGVSLATTVCCGSVAVGILAPFFSETNSSSVPVLLALQALDSGIFSRHGYTGPSNGGRSLEARARETVDVRVLHGHPSDVQAEVAISVTLFPTKAVHESDTSEMIRHQRRDLPLQPDGHDICPSPRKKTNPK